MNDRTFSWALWLVAWTRNARVMRSAAPVCAKQGQEPAGRSTRERRRRFRWWGIALALSAGAPNAWAQAAGGDTLRLADAIRMALANNPMLLAARSEATAAYDRVGPAGALPDPEIQINAMNRCYTPTTGEGGVPECTAGNPFSAAGNVMTQDEQQIMQTFPWPGKLGGAKRAAEHEAAAATADADDQSQMLQADVREAYCNVAYMDRALDVLEQTRVLMKQFLDVSNSMYAVGGAVQQDVLRAQVELGRIAEDQMRMRQDRVAEVARLNGLLGRDATVPVGPLELPEPTGELPAADSLIARGLVARPAMHAASELVEAAEGSLLSARRQLYPDIMLGFATNQSIDLGPTINAMVWFTVPIFWRSKQIPMRREAEANLDAASARLLNVRNETTARIIETRARAEEDRNLVRLYRSGIVPQAQAAVQTSLASYRVGQLSFMQLIDNEMTVKDYDIESYRLLADYQQAVGELSALVGGQVTEESP